MSGLSFGAPWTFAWIFAWPLLLLVLKRASARSPRRAADFELWRRAAETLPNPARSSAPDLRDAALLLPAALLLTALAEPVARGAELRPITIVLDRSASMSAVDGSGATRARRALDRAFETAKAEGRGAIVVGVPPASFDDDPARDCAGVVRDADLVRAARARRDSGDDVVVASDREIPGLPSGVGSVVVADDVRNAGVVALAADGDRLFVRLDADPGAGRRDLVVRDASGRERARRSFSDAIKKRAVFDGLAAPGVSVALEPSDGAPFDDRATLVAAPRRVRASVVGDGLSSLVRALSAQPEVDVAVGFDPTADLFVSRGDVEPPPSKATILAAPFRERRGFRIGPARSVDAASPAIVASSGFEGLFDGGAPWPPLYEATALPSDAVVVCRVDDAPAIVKSSDAAAFLFEIEGSSLALSPGFPLATRRLLAAFGLLEGTALAPEAGPPFETEETLLRSVSKGGAGGLTPSRDRSDVDLAPSFAIAAAVAALAAAAGPFLRRARLRARSKAPSAD